METKLVKIMKMYCNVCNKNRKSENPKTSNIFLKKLGFSIVYSKYGHEFEKNN